MRFTKMGILSIIASIITVFSLGLLLYSVLIPYDPESFRPFAFWIYSVIIALFSMPFYVVLGINSLQMAIMLDDRRFSIFRCILFLAGVPMLVFIGCAGCFLCGVIWVLYYLAMLVVAVMTIFRTRA